MPFQHTKLGAQLYHMSRTVSVCRLVPQHEVLRDIEYPREWLLSRDTEEGGDWK